MTLAMTPREQKIIELKYASKRFIEMDQSELFKWSKALIAKMHIITGWTIPEDELLNILIDQFGKKIIESYKNVNPDEFEYAFRTNGTGVKDWGKNMNLSLIDEVMRPYLSERYDLSLQEEQRSKLLPQIEYKEDMSDKAMQDWFDATANKIKEGQMRIEYVPEMLYEWMDNNGNITATKEQKYEYLNRAVEYRLGVLREALENEDSATNRFALSTFVTMKNNGCLEGKEISIVKTLAKKILLFELILKS